MSKNWWVVHDGVTLTQIQGQSQGVETMRFTKCGPTQNRYASTTVSGIDVGFQCYECPLSETVAPLTLSWNSGPFCWEFPFGSHGSITYPACCYHVTDFSTTGLGGGGYWQHTSRSGNFGLHVPSEHRVKSPTELYFRIWWTFCRQKLLDTLHKASVLGHNLHHLVSVRVGNWRWPSVLHGTNS